MPDLATAMLFDGPGMPLRRVEIPLPVLRPGEVLVRITCSTLCGSDVHTYLGDRSTACPTVLGHEMLGVIANLSEGVCDFPGDSLNVGDRVTWSVAACCGECFFCEEGVPQKCEDLFKYGHERATDSHPLSGGLAEFCHLAAGTAVFRVPVELPDHVACPANCATATVAAALRYAGGFRNETVLIQGAGMLGLTAAAMLHHGGAREVVVCDVNPARLELAKQFGATRTVQVGETAGGLVKVVKEATDGRGVDLVLELSGATSAVETGIEAVRIGGQCIWVGAVFPARAAEISAEQVVRKLISIQGVHNYTPADLSTALDFLSACHADYPFADLVSEGFRLEDADAAFASAAKTGALRIAVRP